MADNTILDAGSGGDTIAGDEITYSGDTAKVQLVRVVHVSGSEGSKTLSEMAYVQDAAHVDPATATTWVMPRDDALATQETTDGDWTLPRANARGAQWVELDLTNDVTIADGGNAITVDWAGTAPPIGAGTEAAALRVTMATDSTGVITVDNAGTFAVQADSVIPGTGATNLGKAIDSVVGATDTGVALLAKHMEDNLHLTTADLDYDVLQMSSLGGLFVEPEMHHAIDNMNATTGWAALNSDTLNLATTTKHTLGTAALTFDKVNGAANTVFGAIAKTFTTFDLGDVSPHDIIQSIAYIPDLTNVAYLFVRLGTDSSNYNEWRIADTEMTAATFEVLAFIVGDADHTGITGNGWNPSSVSYGVVGVAFDSESDTLAGIVFDQISYHTNQHTTAILTAEVSSSVSSPNVRLNGYGGSTDTNTGNASGNTLRVVLATDQPVVSIDDNSGAITVDNAGTFVIQEDGAALTALQLIDDVIVTLGTTTYTEASTKGAVIGAVRNDTLAALANTDNEVAPLQVNASGALYVECSTVASHAVTNAGTFVVQEDGAALTALQLIDDVIVTLGTTTYSEATTKGAVIGAVRNDTLAALANTDNEIAPLQVNASGALYVECSTVASHAVTNAGTFVVQEDGAALTALQLIDDAIATLGTTTYTETTTKGAVVGAVRNDTLAALANTDNEVAPLQVNASGALYVECSTVASHAVTNAGTFAVQVDGDALTALQLIDNVVYTHDAAGGTPVGNMMMGVRDDEVGSTAVTNTDGDATALRTDKFGALKTTQIADATSEIKYAVINAASGDNSIVAALGAGIKARVLACFIISGGTSTCRFEDGAGGTALTGVMQLVANSGFTLPYSPVGWFETGDNTALSLEATGDLDGCLTYVEV